MGKAVPCKTCKTDTFLKWKSYFETHWWITCEGCGQSCPVSRDIYENVSMREAGEEWNRINSVRGGKREKH